MTSFAPPESKGLLKYTFSEMEKVLKMYFYSLCQNKKRIAY